MKTWENAAVVELEISATAEGGQNLNKPDGYWTDVNTNQLYSSYASGGSTTGNSIIVIKPQV